MVSGFALPLYLVISFIGMVALSLMLPHPFYVPGVKLVRAPPKTFDAMLASPYMHCRDA
jgi:hypothetical protein